jgi:5,10-methylenetetrahydromethanopterin reductase
MLEGFGIGFSNITPIASLIAYAELAEHNNLSFWLNEGYHNRSSIVIMSAIAARTRRINLGLGIVSPIIRHPYLIAMDAATLDELSGGRLILGLGIAVSGAKRHGIDLQKARPLETMREVAHILRKLIAGETVSSTLIFPSPKEGVKLGFVPIRKKIPLFLGAMHPKMLQLGGELFDGVLLNYACPLDYVKFAMAHIKEGSKKRQIASQLQVSAFTLLSVAATHDAAIEASRNYLPHYLARAYPITLKYAKISQSEIAPVVEELRKSDKKRASSLVTDDMIRKLTISGTPEECINEIRKFSDAGVNEIIAEQIIGPEPIQSIELIAKEVVPQVVKISQ